MSTPKLNSSLQLPIEDDTIITPDGITVSKPAPENTGLVSEAEQIAPAPVRWQDDPNLSAQFWGRIEALLAQVGMSDMNPASALREYAGTSLSEWNGKGSELLARFEAGLDRHVLSPSNTLNVLPNSPEVVNFELKRRLAEAFLASGFMPRGIRTVEQLLTIAAMGEALGIQPIVAVNMINVIEGKPNVSPQLMLSLVRRSGQLADLAITDDGTTCTVVMTRKGESAHTETFSQQDAVNMGMAHKDNWKKQPSTMRKWRAIAAACRIVFPDIIWGFEASE